ncbi:MAG: nucleotidyltransferase family protein [Proteobacteria bacterium]|nr:nucleotidyltransferase family protein [Pseudomonadota bacterium]
MKSYLEILQILKDHKKRIEEDFSVNEIGIFGSFVKEKQSKESDIDILVGYEVIPDLFEFIRLKNHLSELLDMPVDLVLKSTLKPSAEKEILREVQNL